MLPCTACHRHVRPAATTCPFCSAALSSTPALSPAPALLLGLAMLAACGGKEDSDTDSTTSSTSSSTDNTTTAIPTTDATTGTVTADCGFDPGLPFDRQGPIWQLVSDDGETCVLLERRDDSEPDVIYKAVPYTLLSFKIGHAGVVSEYTDLAQLSWESTHHNWLDVAEAWDSEVRYRLADRYGQDFLDEFDLGAIDEQSKSPLWGPISVHPYVP